MKDNLLHKTPYILIISLFYIFLVLGCNKPTSNITVKKKIVSDSVPVWIEQSQNPKLTTNQKELLLQKAYEYTNSLSTEKIKSNHYSKIAFEAELLVADTLFKNANANAMRFAIQLKDTFKIGDAHWNYGSYYARKEVIDSAYYHYHKAYEQFKLIKHNYYTAKMLYNMAYIQGRLKDYTGSEVTIFEAIPYFEKLYKYDNLYQCYNYLGIIYNNLEEFDRAIFYNKKAFDYLNQIEDKRNYREWTLNNLGLVYQKQKRYDFAIDNFEDALSNENLKNQDYNFYAKLVDNIAYTKFLKGDTLNVSSELQYALKIRDSLDNVSGVVISKRHLSEFYAFKYDTLSAVKLANEAYGLAGQVENNRDKLETLLLLSKIDKEKASIYLNEYVHLNDSLQIEERKIRNKFTRIRFETDEYIEETEKLSQQQVFFSIGALFLFLLFSLAYYIRVQSNKHKELIFEREQQKSNEEIFSLMLKQQTKLEEGRINERHRISQDLHDGVLGKIFGTRLGLGFLNVNGDDSTIEKYKNYVDELQNIEKEIRTISHELKSEILSSKEDFSKIIGDLIDQKCNLGTFEYRYKYDQNIDWDVISDDIKINYYRIIQEALQNIIKYAHANKVSVEIKLNDDYLELLIVDDGIGFDVLAKRKGIGLKNIDSRAINIGGKAIINSEFNKGTTIFVTCSIQNNNNE